MATVDSDGGVVGRSGRAWRAPDAPPTDDDLDPPHEVILPELPSTLINSIDHIHFSTPCL